MSVIATAVKHLLAAGVTGDALVQAIAEMEAEAVTTVDKAAENKRAYDREYRRKQREEQKAESRTTSYDSHDQNDLGFPNKEAPQTPKEINPIPCERIAREAPKIVRIDRAEQALAEWNELRAELWPTTRQTNLNLQRRTKLLARLREVGEDGWRDALSRIRGSPFLRGDDGRWKVAFDWLLEPRNLTKVLEGNYDERAPNRPSQPAGGSKSSVAAGRAVLERLRGAGQH